jgi:hypothetical protein
MFKIFTPILLLFSLILLVPALQSMEAGVESLSVSIRLGIGYTAFIISCVLAFIGSWNRWD